MDNKEIIEKLRRAVALMELHGENDYKIKSYNNALFNLERYQKSLAAASIEELEKINGVGSSIASVLSEIIDHGDSVHFRELAGKTPEGVLEMLEIKGVGAKKIRTLWKEVGIESIPQLLDAINSNKLSDIKGFGKKTQENIKQTILYQESNKGKLHYATAEPIGNDLLARLEALPDSHISISGELRRKMEIINCIECLVGSHDYNALKDLVSSFKDIKVNLKESGPYILRGSHIKTGCQVMIHWTNKDQFYQQLILTTGSSKHLMQPVNGTTYDQFIKREYYPSEEGYYRQHNLPFMPPEIREGQFEFTLKETPELLTTDDIKGVLHCHSNWSDGKNPLREMAEYCNESGYQYLGITDHSKAAYYYANGLYEERVIKQHEEIDQLNRELAPFFIFKGIEADILVNGDLDYEPQTLDTFDFIVASIHSSLNMDRKKATKRILQAIQNPYTTILGHLTGRLLLIREGFPVDHKAIIDACAENQVVIEINAHPNRLDLDWRWVHYAVEQGVKISINPDAHEKTAIHHMYYGVCVGRKGGLTAANTLNTMDLKDLQGFFKKRKQRALNKLSA